MAVLISETVAATPTATAVVDAVGSTTWEELDGRVNALVHALRDAGMQTGDSLVVMVGNQVEFVELSLAALHGGWLLVPVNWHWVADELAYVLADADARALVVDHRWLPVALHAMAEDPRIGAALHACLVVGDAAATDPAATDHAGTGAFGSYEAFRESGDRGEIDAPERGGPMFYTSGTTGRPKGVKSALSGIGGPPEVFTLIAHTMRQILELPTTPPPVQAICGPLYHSAQWAFAFFAMSCGAALVLQHRFDAAELLELIDEHSVTNLHLVPTQMVRLLDVDRAARDRFDGSSLVAVLHGAAPCAPAVKRAMIAWLGPIVTEYYGGTEGGFLTTISAADWLERPGSVGLPTDLVEITVLGPEGEPLGPREPGDLWFRSKLGSDFEYHKAPEKTASAHRGAGLGTLGDIGFLDDDGFLHLSDRRIDMVVSGGVNIYPAEIEGVLAEHEAVHDVAVFGVPHREMGEEVKAAITLRDGWHWSEGLEASLVTLCRDRLAGYKCPRSFDVHESLPRSAAGKLLKRELREPYWRDEHRAI